MSKLTSVYLCDRCSRWWGVLTPRLACAVIHHVNTCCHSGEVRVPEGIAESLIALEPEMKQDITKLPKWAQDLIKDLQERAKYWEDIAEGRGAR